ncbi:histone-lysine N-methyltransferase SETMAR [Trichonephila clavipes]|nr:histone-lysine N-methyltransferase SETMAR [Trichonephila clavipes]
MVEILTLVQRLAFLSDFVVSRLRESGDTSFHPLLNMQANKKEQLRPNDHRTALSFSPLQRYHEMEYGFLTQIVTGDETWGYHFESESKRESKQWKRATSPLPKEIKAVHTTSG